MDLPVSKTCLQLQRTWPRRSYNVGVRYLGEGGAGEEVVHHSDDGSSLLVAAATQFSILKKVQKEGVAIGYLNFRYYLSSPKLFESFLLSRNFLEMISVFYVQFLLWRSSFYINNCWYAILLNFSLFLCPFFGCYLFL